ncbi:hypothetical protein BHM03_00038675 [Ensete ventricosum]|nr:hypothetical protein BHM03_00038675 [Ensete ventricosum]
MSLGRRCRRKHPSRGRPKENISAERPPVEATIKNPNISVSQPSNRSRDVMHLPLEPDIVSLDSTNSSSNGSLRHLRRTDMPHLSHDTPWTGSDVVYNPSIPHGTSALTVLLVIDRKAPVHSARNVQRASQYVAAESLVAGKREDQKKSRGDKPQGKPSRTPRRRDRLELPAPRPLPIPLNSTRTEVFIQIRDKGLLRTPNPIRTKIGGRDKRRYCRFYHDYDHDTEECNDLINHIEDLIHQAHLYRFVRD